MRSTTTRAFGLVLATSVLGLGTAGCTNRNSGDSGNTATARDGTIDGTGANVVSDGANAPNAMTQDTASDQSVAAVLATIDRAEITSSRVALQKAQARSVRDYAQQMITEHVRTSQQLATLARNANLMVPDSAALDMNLGMTGGTGGMSDNTGGMAAGSGGARTDASSGMARPSGSQASTTQPAGGAGNVGGAPGSIGSTAGGTTRGGGGNVGPTTSGAGSTGGAASTGMAGAGTGTPSSAAQGQMRSDSMGGMNRTTGGSTATRSPDAILQELHTDAQATMARLRPLRGAEFDRAYMDAQVAMHSKSLNALGALSASARNAELRSHIDMVSRHVQEHLQKGQMIRQQLGGASGTSGAR